MLHQASHDMGTILTDAPRNRPLAPGSHARRYLPIISADVAVAVVVGLWRDAAPILGRREATRGDVLQVVTCSWSPQSEAWCNETL